MLFDSPAYFLFLIPVVLLYWRLSHRAQTFSFCSPATFSTAGGTGASSLLMIGSTTVDFLIAQKIAPGRADPNRQEVVCFFPCLEFRDPWGSSNTSISSRALSWALWTG